MKRLVAILVITLFTNTIVISQIILSNDTAVCGNFNLNLQALSSVPSSITSDDTHSSIVNIGFTFNFYGVPYTQLIISGNGYLTFNTSSANSYSPYSINAAIPNPGQIPENAIMAPWQDINPGAGGEISYTISGTAPNRMFLVTWCAVPMFSCTSDLHTSQVILHEGTNKIEMFLQNKPLCPSWNSGAAIQGLVNVNSTNFDIVTDPSSGSARNFPLQWTATNEGWEFIPNGTTSYIINQIPYVSIIAGTANWYSDPTFTTLVGTGPSLPINNTTFNNLTGLYTYYVQVSGTCLPASINDNITITFNETCCDFAGDDNIVDICDTGTPFNLITNLNNSPDTNGVWYNSSGNIVSGTFDPSTDPGGIYSYIIPASLNCVADTGFLEINLINTPIVSITSPLNACTGSPPITLIGNPSGGVFSGISVSANTFNPLIIGSNIITYTYDTSICTINVNENMIVYESPTVLPGDIITTNPLCFGESTGTATIIASGGTPGYQYEWYGQDTTALPAGTFNYTVIDSEQCTFNGNITLYDPQEYGALLTTYNSSCYGENNGSVGITINSSSTPPGTVSDTSYCDSYPEAVQAVQPSAIIEEVILNGDNNNINNNTAGTADFYEDYTASMYADITEGQLYAISIKLNGIAGAGNSINNSGGKVYIDYNIDGDFDDAGEEIGVVPYRDNATLGIAEVITFTVPYTGAYGPTRMRVVSQYRFDLNSNGIGPCDAPAAGSWLPPYYGATEDYSIVLNAPTINTNILWNNNATSDSIADLAPGTYSVVITYNDGCTYEDSTEVLEPAQLFFNADINTILCNNTTGQISINPSGGNGGPYSTNWNGINPLAIIEGTYTINLADDNTVGCNIDTIIVISEPDYFSVDFTTSSEEICFNDSVTLDFDFNQGGIAPFTIDYTINAVPQSNILINNTGLSNISVSPIVGNNTYIITNIIDSEGCINQNNINSQAIYANPLPDINITVAPNPICIGDSAALIFSAPNGTPPYIVDYFDGSLAKTENVPAAGSNLLVHPTYTTTYTLSAVTDDKGCEATLTDEASLIVNEIPEVETSYLSEVCEGEIIEINLSFSSGNPPFNIDYNFNGTPTSTAVYNQQGTLSFVSTNPTNIYINTITSDNCIKTINDTIKITTNPLPISSINGIHELCGDTGDVDITIVTTDGNPVYDIIYTDGIHIDSITNATSNETFNTSTEGEYSLVSVIDSKGCKAININGIATVTRYPLPDATINIYPTHTEITDPLIYFQDNSINHFSGTWDFGNGETQASNFNTISHIYSDTGTYQVSLTTISAEGCENTIYQTIIISPIFTIYIPNAFTPNNDLDNDYFMPILEGVQKFEMSIYDRLGTRIFETSHYSNEYCIEGCTASWDGRINNGEVGAVGIYIYHIIITDIKGKSKTFEGPINLIR